MIRVRDLIPGDKLTMPLGVNGPESGIFVGVVDPHPLYPNNFWLVIWWMVERKQWSMDALVPDQMLPGVVERDKRKANLRQALGPNR